LVDVFGLVDSAEGLKMRVFAVAMALALMVVSAHAQGMGKGKKQQAAQKTEDSTKVKADDKAYAEALKRIPNSNEKLDPWKALR
jgi:hypothetical protein